MRKIKFRAWINNKMFHFGLQDSHHYRWEEDKLMQFTGLRDKNGKEIYEGDILKIDISAFGERVGVVEFFEEEFCVKVDKGYYSGGIRYDFPEVIGNIYENKELVKCDK